MKMRWLLLSSLLYSVQITAAPEFIGIQEKAQGQSLTGANLLNDALYANPAASGFTQAYSVEGDYFGKNSFGVSVIDTKTATSGGGVGYFRTPFRGNIDQPLQGVKLMLSERLSNEWAFGIAGKMLWGPNVNGESPNLKDGDLGVLWNIPSFQLGFTIRNVLGGDARLDQEREWSVGARIGWQDTLFLSVSTVSTWNYFKPYQVGVGGEYISPYYFGLKAGYRVLTATGTGFFSAGASMLTPKVALHYVIEVPSDNSTEMEHVFGMTLLF